MAAFWAAAQVSGSGREVQPCSEKCRGQLVGRVARRLLTGPWRRSCRGCGLLPRSRCSRGAFWNRIHASSFQTPFSTMSPIVKPGLLRSSSPRNVQKPAAPPPLVDRVLVLAAAGARAPVLPVARGARLAARERVVDLEDQGSTGRDREVGRGAEVDAPVPEILRRVVVGVRVIGVDDGVGGAVAVRIDLPQRRPPGRHVLFADRVGLRRVEVQVPEVERVGRRVAVARSVPVSNPSGPL